jgi:hypothetical protein
LPYYRGNRDRFQRKIVNAALTIGVKRLPHIDDDRRNRFADRRRIRPDRGSRTTDGVGAGTDHRIVAGETLAWLYLFRIGALSLHFVDARRLGRVLSHDSEIITERGQNTVRGPDFPFFSYERLPEDADLDEYPSAPPVTLAAEETLEFPSVWPGFRATVGEFLAQYRRRQ